MYVSFFITNLKKEKLPGELLLKAAEALNAFDRTPKECSILDSKLYIVYKLDSEKNFQATLEAAKIQKDIILKVLNELTEDIGKGKFIIDNVSMDE